MTFEGHKEEGLFVRVPRPPVSRSERAAARQGRKAEEGRGRNNVEGGGTNCCGSKRLRRSSGDHKRRRQQEWRARFAVSEWARSMCQQSTYLIAIQVVGLEVQLHGPICSDFVVLVEGQRGVVRGASERRAGNRRKDTQQSTQA